MREGEDLLVVALGDTIVMKQSENCLAVEHELCGFDLVLALALDSTVLVKSHLHHPQKIP
jgi:hypothetical protein